MKSSRLAIGSIELLESRIAPAAVFVNATTASYDDVDGDHVKVVFTKGVLNATNVATIVQVSAGGQLTLIDLTSVAATAKGTNITITPTLAGNGDGLANVGAINATGIDLGAVNVKGDLGRVVAGDTVETTAGLKSLTTLSLGEFGTSTGAPDLNSDIEGAIGSVTVKGDVVAAYVSANGTGGKMGPVTITGALIGGTTQYSGGIFSAADMGVVKIGGDVRGGDGQHSGEIMSAGKLASVMIGGSLVGGNVNLYSGEISAAASLGAVKIAGDVVGGMGNYSAHIESGGKLTSVAIAGSLVGGGGNDSAEIFSFDNMGTVTIGGNLQGGDNSNAGVIISDGTLTKVTVTGSVLGGSMLGAGRIFSLGNMGTVTVGGDLRGGAGAHSGYFETSGKITSVSIAGSLRGGSGTLSGAVFSSLDLGTVKIGGDLVGGSVSGVASLDQAGGVFSSVGRIASVTIGGSIRAGTDDSTGTLTRSGAIAAGTDIGALTVAGSFIGSVGTGGTTPVLIGAQGQATHGPTTNLAIGSIKIGGHVENANILAGYDLLAGTTPVAKNGDAQVGPVTVVGDWIASNLVAGAKNAVSGNKSFGNGSDSSIGAGAAGILAKIASITIGGRVMGTAGAEHYGFVAEQIGSFKIAGTTIPLMANAHNDTRQLAVTFGGNVAINEI